MEDGDRWYETGPWTGAVFYRVLPFAAMVFGCSDVNGPGLRATVVFDWLRDGNRDIYRASIDRADTLRLTSDPGDDQHPTSAGGTVVFTSFRDGNGELYAVPANGGAARRLTHTIENETEPAISPDGTRIAYVSDVSGVPKLWLCAIDGSAPHRVTESFGFPGSAEVSPSWSPAGDQLVFVATSNGSANLFIISASGGTPVPLVTGPAADVEPAWSPDGDDVAFASDRDGDVELYLVNIQNGNISRLTHRPGIDAEPGWVADGRLVFTSWVDSVPRLRSMDIRTPSAVADVELNSGEPHHPTGIF